MEVKTTGLILKKIAIKEDSQLLSCFTKDLGKLYVRAVGINKAIAKQRGHLDILCVSSFIVVGGRDIPTVKSASGISSFYNIKSNIVLASCAMLLVEMLEKALLPGVPDTVLWHKTMRALRDLNKLEGTNSFIRRNALVLIRSFLAQLLEIQGYGGRALFFHKKRMRINEYVKNFKFLFEEYFNKRLGSLEFVERVIRER